VRFKVFDAGGRIVQSLFDGVVPAGSFVVPWDGRDSRGRSVPVGVYLYRLETSSATATSKVVRIR
jgi:flagellar hook assembly protein FlgD